MLSINLTRVALLGTKMSYDAGGIEQMSSYPVAGTIQTFDIAIAIAPLGA
jgi:hypothetical protein